MRLLLRSFPTLFARSLNRDGLLTVVPGLAPKFESEAPRRWSPPCDAGQHDASRNRGSGTVLKDLRGGLQQIGVVVAALQHAGPSPLKPKTLQGDLRGSRERRVDGKVGATAGWIRLGSRRPERHGVEEI